MLVGAGILVAILATAAGGWQGLLRWHAARATDVNAQLVWFREHLNSAIGHNGPSTYTFIATEPRQREQDLHDLRARVNDRRLRKSLDRLFDHLREAFAHSPPAGYIGAITATRRRQLIESSEHVREALDEIDVALARVVQLERFIVGR